MDQIMRLRRRAVDDFEIKDQNNGYGHEKAFTELIERYGTLHESQLLPRSFGQGSLIRSQVDPASLKQLVPTTPTVVRGLASGKVSPVKALWHKKLPDQKQVRRHERHRAVQLRREAARNAARPVGDLHCSAPSLSVPASLSSPTMYRFSSIRSPP